MGSKYGVDNNGIVTHGPVYEYIDVFVTKVDVGNDPKDVVYDDFSVWEFDLNKELFIMFEVPKGYDGTNGVPIDLDLCYKLSEVGKKAKFEVHWTVVSPGEPLIGGTKTGTLAPAEVAIPTTAYEYFEVNCGSIAAANLSAGDHVGLRIKRVASSADPVDKIAMFSIDLKIPKNKHGVPV